MLSYSHNELVDDHIMLDIPHEVVIISLNSCEPHSCTCDQFVKILSCADLYYPKKGQSFVVEPPELFQLKCSSHTLRAATHLNRNNLSIPWI
jgi:hypothetical protein